MAPLCGQFNRRFMSRLRGRRSVFGDFCANGNSQLGRPEAGAGKQSARRRRRREGATSQAPAPLDVRRRARRKRTLVAREPSRVAHTCCSADSTRLDSIQLGSVPTRLDSCQWWICSRSANKAQIQLDQREREREGEKLANTRRFVVERQQQQCTIELRRQKRTNKD